MLVSVVVPAHNYGRFLDDALGSVLAQTYGDWECIVVDDGSSDDTAAVARRWTESDPRFRFVRHEVAQGVSAARNRGVTEGRGAFLQFLDADDRLLPEKLARHVRFFDEHPQCGIVYSEAGFFREGEPERLMPSLHGTLSRSILARVHGADEAWAKLQHYNILPTPCALIRREVFERAGGFAFVGVAAGFEDWDFWLRCAAAGVRFDFTGGDEPLVAVRVHASSATRNPHRMADTLIAAARAWTTIPRPLIYDVALGVDAVLSGDRRAGSARIAEAAARAAEPLTAKRWRAYALAARVLPRGAFLRVFAWPMPEWPLELVRRLKARRTPPTSPQ
jgi:glycosyltransferase involved in cell wall biosynthesis